MSQSLSKMYVHIIFSTKHRERSLIPSIQSELHRYIGGICSNLECTPIEINSHLDHIHILGILSKKIAVMNLVKEIKTGSSIWIKNKGFGFANFHWQDGYGTFSVSPNQVDIIKNYIINQPEHHKKKTFQDEYREFLKEYNIEFDERYVWD